MDQADEMDRVRSTRPAALPDMCATVLPSTQEPIVIERGQLGHGSLQDGMTIEQINTVFKATPAQVEAVLVSSMFGWGVPDTDPDRYEACGRYLMIASTSRSEPMTLAVKADRRRNAQHHRSGGAIGFAIIAGYLALFISSPAHADPCTATLPQSGARFTGVVRHVIDGDGLCIGPADQPDLWIEIRLADFYAPELLEAGGAAARQRLANLARGRATVCIARNRSYDRIGAACMLDGRPIGRLLRERGARGGGRGFRR